MKIVSVLCIIFISTAAAFSYAPMKMQTENSYNNRRDFVALGSAAFLGLAAPVSHAEEGTVQASSTATAPTLIGFIKSKLDNSGKPPAEDDKFDYGPGYLFGEIAFFFFRRSIYDDLPDDNKVTEAPEAV